MRPRRSIHLGLQIAAALLGALAPVASHAADEPSLRAAAEQGASA